MRAQFCLRKFHGEKIFMRLIGLSLAIFTVSFLGWACGPNNSESTAELSPNEDVISAETGYWAKENFDLPAAAALLERAEDAEEFEFLINSEDGINNLDLNGDGYVDYISVAEFDDRYDNQRGFALFDKFGPDEIQEIARIVFERDVRDNQGARVYLSGNEQIYGDNYNYETNWLDTSLAIANWLFNDRDDVYESPYYYDNYPSDYTVYRVVEPPVYRTRVQKYYPHPVFVRVDQPFDDRIKIKSKYKGKHYDKIYARMARPTREQIEFYEKYPVSREYVKIVDDGRNSRDLWEGRIEKRRAKRNDRRDDRIDRKEDKREMKDKEKYEKRLEKQERKEDKIERKDKRQERRDDRSSKGKKEKGKDN